MRYDKYRLSRKEIMRLIVIFTVADVIFAYLFYDSVMAAIVMFPLIIPVKMLFEKAYAKKRKREMKLRFVQAIVNVSGGLAAGLSVENAFADACEQIERLYGRESDIAREMSLISSATKAAKRTNEALEDFARRSDIEEIRDFAVVFKIAGEGSGDYSKIIDNCIGLIQRSTEISEEIETNLSGKKYEMRIMSVIPLVIVGYLKLSAGSLIEVLYHNAFGVFVMTVCMMVYFAAVLLSEKICNVVY